MYAVAIIPCSAWRSQIAVAGDSLARAAVFQTSSILGRRSWVAASVEAVALSGLFVAAAAVRLPYLWSIPQFTDETLDSLRSFAVYEGRQLPLTNTVHYIGAFSNYLEAGAFKLFGPSVYTPRLLTCLLGVLTVIATYWLVRQMLGRPAAWLAAALLATSGVHAAASSHLAYPLSSTPLFVTLSAALLVRAVHVRSGWSLAGAAFAFGLALQTHVSALVFLPGAAAYLLWQGRSLLRSRWLAVAAFLFVVAYSNMIVYNVATGFGSLKSAAQRNAAYEAYQDDDESAYLVREGRVLVTLLRFPSSALDTRDDWTDYARDPIVLVYAGLALAGIGLLARRGDPLPALLLASAVLIYPLLGARHDLLPRQGRYLAPLLPLLFTGLAVAAWHLGLRLDAALKAQGVQHGLRATFGALAAGLLVLMPLLALQRYYTESVATGQTNDRLFQLLWTIEASRPNDELVLLDHQLDQERLGGGGTTLRSLEYMLTVRGVPHRDMDLEPERVARRYGEGGVIVVISARTYPKVAGELPLEPVAGQGTLASPAPYGIYRLGPAVARASSYARPDAPGLNRYLLARAVSTSRPVRRLA